MEDMLFNQTKVSKVCPIYPHPIVQVEDIKEAQKGVSSSTVSFASNEMHRLSHTINSKRC